MGQSEYFVSRSGRIISSGLPPGIHLPPFSISHLRTNESASSKISTHAFQNLFGSLIETGIFYEKFCSNCAYLYLILARQSLINPETEARSDAVIYHGQFARAFETRINLHAPRAATIRFAFLISSRAAAPQFRFRLGIAEARTRDTPPCL